MRFEFAAVLLLISLTFVVSIEAEDISDPKMLRGTLGLPTPELTQGKISNEFQDEAKEGTSSRRLTSLETRVSYIEQRFVRKWRMRQDEKAMRGVKDAISSIYSRLTKIEVNYVPKSRMDEAEKLIERLEERVQALEALHGASPPQGTPCLLLWNRFEDKANVATSDVGPGFTIMSWLKDDWTEASIEPGYFGNGLLINPKPDARMDMEDGSNFFALDLYEVGLTSKRGAIEWWFTSGVDSTTFDWGVMYKTDDYLTNHFCGAPTDDAPNGVCNYEDHICCFATQSEKCCETGWYKQVPVPSDDIFMFFKWDGWDGPDRKRFQFYARSGTDEFYATTPNKQTFSKGDHIHFGVAWDMDGMDGSTDTIRLYVNGVLEDASTDSWDASSTHPFMRYFYLGTTPHSGPMDQYYNAAVGVFDNIKMWNMAKTDYSDRFDEDAGAENVCAA